MYVSVWLRIKDASGWYSSRGVTDHRCNNHPQNAYKKLGLFAWRKVTRLMHERIEDPYLNFSSGRSATCGRQAASRKDKRLSHELEGGMLSEFFQELKLSFANIPSAFIINRIALAFDKPTDTRCKERSFW